MKDVPLMDRLSYFIRRLLLVIPTFLGITVVCFLLTRLFDWVNTPAGAMVTRKDPMEYLHKLRFFRGATTAEALGG